MSGVFAAAMGDGLSTGLAEWLAEPAPTPRYDASTILSCEGMDVRLNSGRG